MQNNYKKFGSFVYFSQIGTIDSKRDTFPIMDETEKVKVVRLVGGVPSTKPTDTRWVTKTAAGYLKPKWVIAEDQGGAPSEKKTVDAAPVVSQDERMQQIRSQYLELAGENVNPDYMEFNQARLFVEISNLKKAQAQNKVNPAYLQAKEEAPKKAKAKKETVSAE